MNISLTPQQERLIQEKLKSGKYSTVDRVIDEALQLLEERDRQDENWLEETRRKVAVGSAEVAVAQLGDNFHQHFLEDANKAYTALKSSPAAWQAEIEERQLWDGTLADGLDWEED